MSFLARFWPTPSPDSGEQLGGRAARLRRIARITALVARAVVALLLLYVPCTLLIHAETGGGRLVGASFTLTVVALVAFRELWSRKARRPAAIAGGAGLLAGLLFLVVAWAVAPDCDLPEGAFSVHWSGDAVFTASALSNIVPEIDQLTLGSYLMPYADPIIDRAQGVRIRRLLLDAYREMRGDDAFVEAGSALGLCYDDAVWGSRATLHFYQYLPRQSARKPCPVFVFLHGAMGNFKGYVWVFKRLADEHGFAIIAPTFGAGMWNLDRDSSVLRAVHEHIAAEPALDGSRIYLAGLSNGAMGLTRGAVHHGERYRGLAFISPVIEPGVILSPAFARHCAGKPALIIHGERDRRIPAEAVRAGAQILASRGMSVRSRFYEDEDHFLLFSQRESIVQELASWLEKCEAARQLSPAP